MSNRFVSNFSYSFMIACSLLDTLCFSFFVIRHQKISYLTASPCIENDCARQPVLKVLAIAPGQFFRCSAFPLVISSVSPYTISLFSNRHRQAY